MATEVQDRPFVRSPKQLRDIVEQLDARGYELEKLDELKRTVEEKEQLATHLRDIDPSINGNVDHLVEDLALYRQEAEAKKSWSVWEFVKSVPGRLWNTVKKHPRITAAVVAAGLIAAAYYSGLGAIAVDRIRDWVMTKFGGGALAGAAEAAKGAAEGAAETVTGAVESAAEAAEGVIESMPKPPFITPEPVPIPSLPTGVPSAEEALKILEELEKTSGM